MRSIGRSIGQAAILLGVVVLSACQPRPRPDPLADVPQDVPTGSTFTLNQSIVIPAGTPAVYFQDAQLVAQPGLRPHYAYCRFGTDDPASVAREIKPQPFVVGSVSYEEQASGPVGEAVSLTRMNLQTSQKVQGYSMICGLPGPAESARFVTVSQINGAVGGYFTLKRLF
jgi:hypothetical protein